MSVQGKGFSSGLMGLLSVLFLSFSAVAGEGARSGSVTFADIDQDGNGCISEEEFRQFHGRMHGKGMGQGRGHAHGTNKGHGGGCCAGQGMKGNMPAFADFDLDGDGSITEIELNQGRAKRMSENAAEGRQMKHAGNAPAFSDIDGDGDGGISEEEFAAHQAEHHKKMHENKGAKDE